MKVIIFQQKIITSHYNFGNFIYRKKTFKDFCLDAKMIIKSSIFIIYLF